MAAPSTWWTFKVTDYIRARVAKHVLRIEDQQGEHSGFWIVVTKRQLNERVERHIGSNTRFLNKSEFLRFALIELCDELDRNPMIFRKRAPLWSDLVSGKCQFVREAAKKLCDKLDGIDALTTTPRVQVLNPDSQLQATSSVIVHA